MFSQLVLSGHRYNQETHLVQELFELVGLHGRHGRRLVHDEARLRSAVVALILGISSIESKPTF